MEKINPFEIELSHQYSRPRWRDDDNIIFEEDDFSYASSGSSGGGDFESESLHLLDVDVEEEEEEDGRVGKIWANPIRLLCMSMIASVCFAIAYLLSTDGNNTSSAASLDGNGGNAANQRIVILGERNSGVPWMLQQLARCYPTTEVTNILQRSGEWFQDETLYQYQQQRTLVIALFLNPYDWVNAMRLNPINMPSHTNVTSWKTFVKTPWTDTEGRPESDALLTDQKSHQCQFNFSFNQVIPCTTSVSYNSNYPVYELIHGNFTPAGEPYSNIVQLRRDKILNFLNVQNWKQTNNSDKRIGLIEVRYEDLTKISDDDNAKPGLFDVFAQIEQRTGIKSKCDIDSSFSEKDTNNDIDSFIAPAPIASSGTLDPKYVSWMRRHVEWEVEARVGYEPTKLNENL
uniref:Sulfotransferase domain-containing protein n=1 Tax=Ditylum brightwellii TaxID=49249 RepID=A0A6U3SML2_9STRA|mmetsp:Transcript_23781/g.35505  ORF Transcript_23781/g.35505 Transcript_23781/m.35505 type:complete len:402 (+) Transcript_23781:62-1267(+)